MSGAIARCGDRATIPTPMGHCHDSKLAIGACDVRHTAEMGRTRGAHGRGRTTPVDLGRDGLESSARSGVPNKLGCGHRL